MAELYLARDPRTDKFLVIKRILPYLAEEAEFVKMFLDEARIAASLHHANVVEVYELGQLESSIFIAMEWVDGPDLRRVLQHEQERGGVVPPGIAAWIVARLAEGLHYAHFRGVQQSKPLGIIHRDVSPQNIMVSYKAEVKLVDFGIAKATAWMSRSKPGIIKGKFLYLAPEQLGQEKLDHRSDLFAVGTLLYELTTGKSPFYRPTTEAVIYAIRMEDPPPPHTLRPGYPASLSRIVLKCLAKDRDDRYQTGEEIAAALEDFMRVDAPTTRGDVVRYISGLFGSDDERTSIFLPPNAEGERTAPLGPEDDDKTVSMTSRPKRLSEGRRPTPEPAPEVTPKVESLPIDQKRTDQERAVPRDDFPTAPIADTRARGADWAPGLAPAPEVKVAGLARAGAESWEPTAVSVSGAREVPIGGVLPSYEPTRMGDSLGPPVPSTEQPLWKPNVVPEPEAPLPPIRRPEPPPRRPGPPIPTPGELSVGTIRERNPEPPRTEPRPPPRERSQRSPLKPGKARRRVADDPDDNIATVDLGGIEPSMPASADDTRRQLIILGSVGVAGLAALVLLAWLLWPSGGSRPKPPHPQVIADAGPQPPGAVVMVQLRAPRGTTIVVDGVAVNPGDSIPRGAGLFSVAYRCPPKKKGAKPDDRQVSVQVPVGSVPDVGVDLSCK